MTASPTIARPGLEPSSTAGPRLARPATATRSRSLVVGVLVGSPGHAPPTAPRLVSELATRGHRVTLISSDTPALGNDRAWCRGLDLLLAPNNGPTVPALLGAAESVGVRCLNSHAGVTSVRDRTVLSARLRAAGVPTPVTHVAAPQQLAFDASVRLPVILKRTNAGTTTATRVAWSRAELATLRWSDPVALAQHFVASDGYDITLYGIGEHVWAVRRLSPRDQRTGERVPSSVSGSFIEVTPHLARIAQQCRAVTALDLYSIDCVNGARGLVVTGIDDAPDYTGVPNATTHLVDLAVEHLAKYAA